MDEVGGQYLVDSDFNNSTNSLESKLEGTASCRYVTIYERDRRYREQAIATHGCTCKACGFNFGQFYGEYGFGYIHIHHVEPVSELESPKIIDPETDLIPLCANCHSIVHRRNNQTFSIPELVELILKASAD